MKNHPSHLALCLGSGVGAVTPDLNVRPVTMHDHLPFHPGLGRLNIDFVVAVKVQVSEGDHILSRGGNVTANVLELPLRNEFINVNVNTPIARA